MQNSKTISKSQFIKGKQCSKALWFYRYRKDLTPAISPEKQALFDEGNEIGILAQECFEGGVEVTNKFWDIKGGELATKDFLAKGHNFIFEATAVHPETGNYSRIDILRRNNDESFDLIEVKSSTKVKDYHLDDMAFQYHIFNAAGYNINQCLMVVINNEYIRQGDLEPNKLFKFEDITETVMSKQEDIHQISEGLKLTLSNKNLEPEVNIGTHCDSPFECDYKHHCWSKIPEYSILNIISKDKAFKISNDAKSFDIKDLAKNNYPSGKKLLDTEAFLENKTLMDKANIRIFLEQVKYPLYFLDYETLNSKIPPYNNSKPFEQIPFQFSLHIQETENSELLHTEFLHKERTDPRREFTENLISSCGKEGSIISYNAKFEKGVNNNFATLFPEYKEQLQRINERMVDLLVPFNNRWLYRIKYYLNQQINKLGKTDSEFKRIPAETLDRLIEKSALKFINFIQSKLSELTEKAVSNLYIKLIKDSENNPFDIIKKVTLYPDNIEITFAFDKSEKHENSHTEIIQRFSNEDYKISDAGNEVNISHNVDIKYKKISGRLHLIEGGKYFELGDVDSEYFYPEDKTFVFIAKSFYWHKEMNNKKYISAHQISKIDNHSVEYTSRAIRQRYLSPKIIEHIIYNNSSKQIGVDELISLNHWNWEVQEKAVLKDI